MSVQFAMFDAPPSTIRFSRAFGTSSGDTLSIKPIRDWVSKWISKSTYSIDPFARNSTLADVTNDLNPETTAQYHLDAEEFCHLMARGGSVFDLAIFDPPYSPRQISELYKNVGLAVGMKETQNARLYKRVRDALDPIISPGGVVLSFGWHSNGMGVGRGYEAEEILLVQHGGAHNDTICLAERKRHK